MVSLLSLSVWKGLWKLLKDVEKEERNAPSKHPDNQGDGIRNAKFRIARKLFQCADDEFGRKLEEVRLCARALRTFAADFTPEHAVRMCSFTAITARV